MRVKVENFWIRDGGRAPCPWGTLVRVGLRLVAVAVAILLGLVVFVFSLSFSFFLVKLIGRNSSDERCTNTQY